jgi:formylglycine-generating enzyme required for sulfatase activity
VSRKVYIRGSLDGPLTLVAELCPTRKPKDEKEWSKVWLAGAILLEVGLNRVERTDFELGRELLPRVQNRLVQLLKGSHLTPRERAEAGNTLAKLGDPRPGIIPLSQKGEGLGVRVDFLFCEIPAGKFWMGSKKGEKDSQKSEYPQFEYNIPYNYFMSRYPITNAQFDLFVKDPNGYVNNAWWTKAGLEWRKDQKEHKRYGGVFALSNHPVVGVTWYEATAFTRWATKNIERLTLNVWKDGKIEPLKSGTYEVRLPSEAEWERAARGGKSFPYPWGDTITANQANYSDTHLNATSAVGAFPLGMNDYGLLDMSGNVWEWCATQWQENYAEYLEKENNKPEGNVDRRVVRGGAFLNSVRFVRCAFRLRYNPDYWYEYLGFRVVVSPVFQ